ncbi:MAG: outer membrane protein assembly factor BamA [Phycisphaerae bacterium]|nr:outer membrane protein assembly factor BamA [Phycisphaerae bacterium]
MKKASTSFLSMFLSCACCLFFLFINPLAHAVQDVGKVEIGEVLTAGNVSISKAEILSKVRTREGQIFDAEAAGEDALRVAELEGVEYCFYNTKILDGKVVLTFVVVEKSLIRSIEFLGNKKVKSSTLLKKSKLKRGDYLERLLIEEAKKELMDYYHKKGYAFAGVEVDREKLGEGNVVFNISEGSRVKIGSVKFEGNSHFSDKSLKKALKTRKRKFFVFSAYYVEDKVGGDVDKIAGIYDKKGYLDTKVEAKKRYSGDNRRVDILFSIVEGPQFTIESISIDGNKEYSESELGALVKNQAGLPYSQFKTDADAKRILKYYREKGFIDAEVLAVRSFVGADRAAIAFNVSEGERFRIGAVDITGNEETQDKVIRRVLDEYEFVPGQWYNGDIARGDGSGHLERTVQRQTLTKSAVISATGEKEGQRDAAVSIIEGQTGSIMLGAGLASDSGVIGQFVFEQRNFDIKDKPKSFGEFITGKAFKGAGQHLRLSLQPGTEVSEYSLSFTEPYLHNKPVSLNVVGSSWERGRESYDEQRTKGYIGLEKRYNNKYSRSLGFRVENVDLGGLDADAPQEIIDDKGSNLIGGIRLGFAKDMTDDRFLPTSGHTLRGSYEQVAGDHTFGILSGTFTRYRTLNEDLAERKTILSTKLHAGAIVGDAPVFEKFYAGGSRSIRGFEYRGVSTRGLQTNVANPKREDPVGSDWILLGNAEVVVPLASDTFSILFFADAGAIDSGGIRASIGTGIQIMLPQWFGPVPMRFELAAPLMKESEDDTQIFSFSVGTLF